MKKILVANRGEIALRIMKTIKKMGIKTVAIFSEPDKNALHVRFADEAVCVGEAASSKSYLDMTKIIDCALSLKVDGIHPGYGFLSENSIFAQKVKDAGMIFIGPEPESITLMGSKLAAKECVKKYDIPMVPGTDTAIENIDEAKLIAKKIGFPILIKASAGGGGKGMRVVENSEEFEEQMQRATSEATSAFGDGSVFIEKYVASPRHIEVQVLGDKHGSVVHLFERECSIQRRHQKVIEEAPSAILTLDIRKKIGEAAVKVAQSCNYVGAGTVEFLLDEKLNFYFLEMNTRLQVEHPVTEMITGIDLVAEQIKIARGEKLSFNQEDLKIKGHAIELRVYAEDPLNDFLPSIGTITTYQKPHGEGIRLDDAYELGMDIPIYYDPMIAKLVSYGENREEAIEKMKVAINEYVIEGFATTLPFGEFVMNHSDFVSAQFDTHFVKDNFSKEIATDWQKNKAYKAAVLAIAKWKLEKEIVKVPLSTIKKWKTR
jgi:pyruvate carboxylase subunit A